MTNSVNKSIDNTELVIIGGAGGGGGDPPGGSPPGPFSHIPSSSIAVKDPLQYDPMLGWYTAATLSGLLVLFLVCVGLEKIKDKILETCEGGGGARGGGVGDVSTATSTTAKSFAVLADGYEKVDPASIAAAVELLKPLQREEAPTWRAAVLVEDRSRGSTGGSPLVEDQTKGSPGTNVVDDRGKGARGADEHLLNLSSCGTDGAGNDVTNIGASSNLDAGDVKERDGMGGRGGGSWGGAGGAMGGASSNGGDNYVYMTPDRLAHLEIVREAETSSFTPSSAAMTLPPPQPSSTSQTSVASRPQPSPAPDHLISSSLKTGFDGSPFNRTLRHDDDVRLTLIAMDTPMLSPSVTPDVNVTSVTTIDVSDDFSNSRSTAE